MTPQYSLLAQIQLHVLGISGALGMSTEQVNERCTIRELCLWITAQQQLAPKKDEEPQWDDTGEAIEELID